MSSPVTKSDAGPTDVPLPVSRRRVPELRRALNVR
jgi:hypothetical protein